MVKRISKSAVLLMLFLSIALGASAQAKGVFKLIPNEFEFAVNINIANIKSKGKITTEQLASQILGKKESVIILAADEEEPLLLFVTDNYLGFVSKSSRKSGVNSIVDTYLTNESKRYKVGNYSVIDNGDSGVLAHHDLYSILLLPTSSDLSSSHSDILDNIIKKGGTNSKLSEFASSDSDITVMDMSTINTINFEKGKIVIDVERFSGSNESKVSGKLNDYLINNLACFFTANIKDGDIDKLFVNPLYQMLGIGSIDYGDVKDILSKIDGDIAFGADATAMQLSLLAEVKDNTILQDVNKFVAKELGAPTPNGKNQYMISYGFITIYYGIKDNLLYFTTVKFTYDAVMRGRAVSPNYNNSIFAKKIANGNGGVFINLGTLKSSPILAPIIATWVMGASNPMGNKLVPIIFNINSVEIFDGKDKTGAEISMIKPEVNALEQIINQLK